MYNEKHIKAVFPVMCMNMKVQNLLLTFFYSFQWYTFQNSSGIGFKSNGHISKSKYWSIYCACHVSDVIKLSRCLPYFSVGRDQCLSCSCPGVVLERHMATALNSCVWKWFSESTWTLNTSLSHWLIVIN